MPLPPAPATQESSDASPTVLSPDRWTVHPEASALVADLVGRIETAVPALAEFRRAIQAGGGVRLLDIVDHVAVPDTPEWLARLAGAGFILREAPGDAWFFHPGGMFPRVVAMDPATTRLGIRTESVERFLWANGIIADVEGQTGGMYRRAMVWRSRKAEVWVVERHGHPGLDMPSTPSTQLAAARRHAKGFLRRRRRFATLSSAFNEIDRLADAAVADLGTGWACALFLEAERQYWEQRNRAARVQKARQDALGLGWANQDHHTYDASRRWFHRTIAVLERLGFECRERFYAGAEAGWGSQILEQPEVGTVVFADLDLAPHELTIDFAHQPLEPLPYLRRAGLWCALHGESMLEAGLNHLECMFDAAALRAQLAERGITMMAPFSDFPHLYQELTLGERWPVSSSRLQDLVAEGLVSRAEAEEFRLNGAIGSHLENLERNFGFKGFNQPGISDVLGRIDPRVAR